VKGLGFKKKGDLREPGHGKSQPQGSLRGEKKGTLDQPSGDEDWESLKKWKKKKGGWVAKSLQMEGEKKPAKGKGRNAFQGKRKRKGPAPEKDQ